MRILSFLFKSAIFLSMVAVIGFFIGREVLLFSGVAQVRNAAVQLRQASQNMSQYMAECQKRGATESTVEVIEQIHLRFVDSQDYRVEVLCRHLSLDPVVVSEHSLPPFVTKVPGTSGLIWNSGLQAVSLSLWGRTRSFVLEGAELRTVNQVTNVPLANGPLTSCAGYGYTCCSVESAQGFGDQITVAQDCPRTCYQSCVARPVLLSFSTDPYYQPQTRTLEVAPNQDVIFSYVADFGGSRSATVILDFGDGTQQTLTTAEGTATHAYTCAATGCVYRAQLSITNRQDIESVPTTISEVIINVL